MTPLDTIIQTTNAYLTRHGYLIYPDKIMADDDIHCYDVYDRYNHYRCDLIYESDSVHTNQDTQFYYADPDYPENLLNHIAGHA